MIACRSLCALGLVSSSLAACQASPEPAEVDAISALSTIQRRGDPTDDQCLIDFLDVGSGLAVFIRCKPAGGSVIRILYDGGSVDPELNKQAAWSTCWRTASVSRRARRSIT